MSSLDMGLVYLLGWCNSQPLCSSQFSFQQLSTLMWRESHEFSCDSNDICLCTGLQCMGCYMAPFIVLVTLFVLLSVLGHFQLPIALGWWSSLRCALAAMFLLTASAHWGKRRPDLIAMIPPVFPKPDMLITLTGALEIIGAAGLMLPTAAPYSALMLLAVFPANVYAARKRLTIAGSQVPALFPRTLLQIVFLTATVAVFIAAP